MSELTKGKASKARGKQWPVIILTLIILFIMFIVFYALLKNPVR